jgi:hypothetical protein
MPPNWFNPHGLKMSLGDYPICQVTHENEVLVGSNVARLQIRPSMVNQGKYQVLWQINHGPGEFVQGQVQLTKGELEEAFELCPNPPRNVFAEHINVDAAIQGHYVRKNRWLTIPAPGPGFDGDPNISIFVTDDLQDAVRKLIKS